MTFLNLGEEASNFLLGIEEKPKLAGQFFGYFKQRKTERLGAEGE